jgi:hypothetical protein
VEIEGIIRVPWDISVKQMNTMGQAYSSSIVQESTLIKSKVEWAKMFHNPLDNAYINVLHYWYGRTPDHLGRSQECRQQNEA